MKVTDLVVAASIVALALLLSYAMLLGGIGPVPVRSELRTLALNYILLTYNPAKIIYSALAPEGVTAIVWDYRGLDTYFETAVMFLAIISVVALTHGCKVKIGLGKGGMSLIVKTTTRILMPLIVLAGISITMHGWLTPGGGFQGGATIAVATVLALVTYSIDTLAKHGIRKKVLLAMRSTGLIGIALTAVALLIIGLAIGVNAYIFQNQKRIGSPLAFPAYFSGTPTGGSLLFYNLFEAFAVSAGLSLAIIVTSLREEEVKETLRGEGVE